MNLMLIWKSYDKGKSTERLTETAAQQNSQLLIATHSEVVLNEAGDRHTVTAFIGTPHRMDGRSSQVFKALAEIGFENYLQAAQQGWVLYLEGSTDLTVLHAFARQLGHQAETVLDRPFVHYVGNQPMRARQHFYGVERGVSRSPWICLIQPSKPTGRSQRRIERVQLAEARN